MYHKITDPVELKLMKQAHRECSGWMQELREGLHEYGVNVFVRLIGSAERKIVVQNGTEPVDFDYNLVILNYDETELDDRGLKDTARGILDDIMRREKLLPISDSTSVLSSKEISYVGYPSFRFKFDAGFVRRDGEKWYRLVHGKTAFTSYTDTFEWKQLPDLSVVYGRYREILHANGYELVFDHYLNAKNRYLTLNDDTHPSYVCFAEAVNEVYNQLRQMERHG